MQAPQPTRELLQHVVDASLLEHVELPVGVDRPAVGLSGGTGLAQHGDGHDGVKRFIRPREGPDLGLSAQIVATSHT